MLYEGHWDASLKPNTHNIRTKNKGLAHHCPICDGPTKIACYLKLHWAFCTAPVTVNGKSEICGERFAPKSPGGCGKHKYSDNFNQVVKEAWKGNTSILEVIENSKAQKPEQAAVDSNETENKENMTWQEHEKKKQYEKRDRQAAKTLARTRAHTKKTGAKTKFVAG